MWKSSSFCHQSFAAAQQRTSSTRKQQQQLRTKPRTFRVRFAEGIALAVGFHGLYQYSQAHDLKCDLMTCLVAWFEIIENTHCICTCTFARPANLKQHTIVSARNHCYEIIGYLVGSLLLIVRVKSGNGHTN